MEELEEEARVHPPPDRLRQVQRMLDDHDPNVVIELSKDFNENEIKRFKKMLQQGGSIKIKGNTFQIIREDTQHRNNKGEVESPFIKTLEE